MNCKFRNEITANGYDFSVMKSGLQKYIRRGDEDKALRCAEEMDRFAEMGHDGERLRTNMLHRLQIIFLEDISIGNYYLWEYMCQWMTILFDERKKTTRDRNVEVKTLELIIRNLCKSKKTRAASFMNSLCSLTAEDVELLQGTGYAEIIVNKSLNEYLTEFDILMSQKSWKSILILKKIFIICIENTKNFTLIESLMEKYVSLKCCKMWKKDLLKLSEGFCLYFVPLAKYLFGTEDLQLDLNCVIFNGIWPCRGTFDVDEYVLDKHVKSKLVKHKTTAYFAVESSIVIPEVFRLPPIMKDIYLWVRCGKQQSQLDKLLDKNIPDKQIKFVEITDITLETKLEFITRIQLVTGKSKTDTYYSYFAGELMFVKGPYKSDKQIKDFIKFQEEKKELGMPYIDDVNCIYLVPDRWPEGTPLGQRNSLDRTKRWPFLICKSMYDINEIKTRQHSSRLWPLTEVVDTKMCIDADVYKLKGQHLLDYFMAIAFRISQNIGDLADRNFMIKGNSLYSIDEEYTEDEIILITQFKEKKYKYLKAKYIENKYLLSEWVINILDIKFDLLV
jgi:hypothetical protein